MTKITNPKKHKVVVFQLLNFEFGYCLRFRILCLGFLLLVLFLPSKAEAGLIMQRPLYVGLTNGLVGYWSFDGQDMAGVTAYDRSGNGNDGTLTNGPTRSIGRLGQALNFDRAGSDKVDAGSAVILDNLSTISVSAWIYPRSEGGTNGGAIVDKQGSGVIGWSFNISSVGADTNVLRFQVNHATTDLNRRSSDNAINLNRWQHVAVTFASSTVQNLASDIHIYINGSEVGYKASVDGVGSRLSDASVRLVIGDRDGDGADFDGPIDDVRVYNRALGPDEIRRLYNMGATTKFNVSKQSPSDPINRGLVGYWSLDGPTHGTSSVSDLSGNNNTGFLTNGPSKAIGRIGQALSFDGSDDYVGVGTISALSSSPVSVSAWIYLRRYNCSSTNDCTIVQQATNDLQLTTNDGVDYRFCRNFSSCASTSISVIKLNTWHLAVGTANGTTCRLYLDGNLLASASCTGSGTGNIRIGEHSAGGKAFNGLIDEVRIYNRALDPDEIRRLYNMGATTKFNVSKKSPSDPINRDLVGYWSFDGQDMAGVTAYDRSGQNNTGTLTNGPVRNIGKLGQALSFDGSDDYVDISSFPSNDIFTATAWFYPRSYGNNFARVIQHGSSSGGFGLEFDASQAPGQDEIYGVIWNGTTATRVVPAEDTSLNTWHHVALVYDGSTDTATIYVDGVNKGNANSPMTVPGNLALRIGDPTATGEVPINGLIDDVRIYNRALSPDEIRRLYHMGR